MISEYALSGFSKEFPRTLKLMKHFGANLQMIRQNIPWHDFPKFDIRLS